MITKGIKYEKLFVSFKKGKRIFNKKRLALLDSGYTPLTVYSFLVLEGKKNNSKNL